MMQGSIVEANVISKKKRDERANREKQEILNPERLERAKIKRKKKIFWGTLLGILFCGAIIFVSFEIMRAIGKNSGSAGYGACDGKRGIDKRRGR